MTLRQQWSSSGRAREGTCPHDNLAVSPQNSQESISRLTEGNFIRFAFIVIQRRIDGSVNFNRSWKEYKQGFGFLSSEFWIGNDKLSYLTNQKRYELRIDMSNYEGSVFYVAYSMFRLSDEWSGYSLTKLGSYIGPAGKYRFASFSM
ncbi:Fibrinogen-like protein A [Holothuria leucospilota]|uniref:Fibrinogen-like protein A n=1 Tax=Holothuria leucospilota TaxID=206669 RepID=A0A9Q1H739_HOLLE|nr:Fibrinogen-like protein A [Holothuria leucospilota]